jgi:hypothetical protein
MTDPLSGNVILTRWRSDEQEERGCVDTGPGAWRSRVGLAAGQTQSYIVPVY